MSGRKRKPPPLAEVLAIPGAKRPEDAFKFLAEAHAAGSLRGVIIGFVTGDDRDVEMRSCGDVRFSDLALAGAILLVEAGD